MSGDGSMDKKEKKERIRSTVKRVRKIYDYGDRINLNIPGYIDKITLDWINAQPQVATKIWELVIKVAHEEAVNSDPLSILKSLGLDNIAVLSSVIKASQNTIISDRDIVDSSQIPNEEDVTLTKTSNEIVNQVKDTETETEYKHINGSSGEEVIEEIDDEFNFPNINQVENEKEVLPEKIELISNDKDFNDIRNIDNPSYNEIVVAKDQEELYRKDGHMNLKAIATKSSGGRRGLSRNTLRTQLDANKPNLMEKEIFGDD